MKVSKFNELNESMCQFFDACEIQVWLCQDAKVSVLKVVDKTQNNKELVKIYFKNTIDVNTHKNFDSLELNVSYDYSSYSSDLNESELSAIKNLIKIYKEA